MSKCQRVGLAMMLGVLQSAGEVSPPLDIFMLVCFLVGMTLFLREAKGE